MLAIVEIIALMLFVSVAVSGLLLKFVLSKRLDDIDGMSEVMEEKETEGTPVAKL